MIRSGGRGFVEIADAVAAVESAVVVMNEGGGWNDGGACRVAHQHPVPANLRIFCVYPSHLQHPVPVPLVFSPS